MKRKGGLYSFFTPKTKATKIENELSKTDRQDEVEGEREDEDEAEGERKDIEGERHDMLCCLQLGVMSAMSFSSLDCTVCHNNAVEHRI